MWKHHRAKEKDLMCELNKGDLGSEQRMPAYVAMLRGINVAGHKTIRMEHLRALCSDIGFQNVETYVQSGNIVFQTTAGNPVAISKSISEVILESLGFDVPVIVRTSKEIRSVIANNPFLKEKNIDSSQLHVTFLSETPQRCQMKKLEVLTISQDQNY